MKFLAWLFPPCDYAMARSLFLRGLGAVFLIAILSWWVQAGALIGRDGLVPVAEFLGRAGEYLDYEGRSRFWTIPTVFWIGDSNGWIHGVCAIGVVLALLVIAGIAPGPGFAGLWIIYLSLVSTGNVFMSFQWDILLLEAGVLALLLAPWSVKRMRWRCPPPLGWGERFALWLGWFVIAKLMFQSGWVKLAWATAGQPEWWPDHTAMTFHYMTQPIPTWTAWWMHQLPAGFHKASIWPMYFVEMGLPFFVFLGARLRLVAAIGFTGLMLLVMATGNFTYFNWLTIVLCFPLVADRYWQWPRRAWRKWRERRESDSTGLNERSDPVESESGSKRFDEKQELASLAVRAVPLALIALLNVFVCLRDWHQASRVSEPLLPWTHLETDPFPGFVYRLAEPTYPFHLVNGYGLFRTMTTDRPEIVIEGSRDGVEWRAYDVRWKPDKLHHRPKFVAPHQPRVAWQFWFFALEERYHPRSRNAPWFARLILGLLENDSEALAFFKANPFPGEPPEFIRATLYQYEFTTGEERRRNGDWWKRRKLGPFLPAQSRDTLRRGGN